jgi:WD40 repeat protein
MNVNTAGGREWAVTGQVGKSPAIFVWNTSTAEKMGRWKLNKNSRAVSACAISSDMKYIAVADKHNDHNIFVFDTSTPNGKPIWEEKGGPDEIFDITITK